LKKFYGRRFDRVWREYVLFLSEFENVMGVVYVYDIASQRNTN